MCFVDFGEVTASSCLGWGERQETPSIQASARAPAGFLLSQLPTSPEPLPLKSLPLLA